MDKNSFIKFREIIDECLRIKFNILLFINYLMQYCNILVQQNIFDILYVREILINVCGIYFSFLQKMKGNEILLQNLLENNKKLYNFLINEGLYESILKSNYSFGYNLNEIADPDANPLNKSEILNMLEKDFIKIKNEISSIQEFKIKLKHQISQLSLCFYCKQKEINNYGIHKCRKCNNSVCEDHFFGDNKCFVCFKKEYQENKRKI